ncbi:MAG TPA: NAD(P)-binding protein [Kofleriaceae bacterium]|nr:NAD(P)-binding protein [Kofleriaceae bacterium]
MQQRRRRHDLRTTWFYTLTILREFRATLAALAAILAVGTLLHAITPQPELGGARPGLLTSAYGAWMMLFAQPPFNPPATWYLELAAGLYPLLGVVLIGEGIVRFALLMMSRRRGEKEWMRVKASTYRDHVVLCGLGHLGFRVLQQLIHIERPVVAIEKDPSCRFLDEARATGVPVLVRDMKDDQALVEAGVPYARTILIATNDDMANLEVALDARRLNPRIRISMRQYDQTLAGKFKEAFDIDFAFSSSALAAAAVAATSMPCRVVAAYDVDGKPYVTAEVRIDRGSPLAGRTLADLEASFAARVVCRTPAGGPPEAPPAAAATVVAGDALLIHAAVASMERLTADAGASS